MRYKLIVEIRFVFRNFTAFFFARFTLLYFETRWPPDTELGMNSMALETTSSLLLLISHNRQQQHGGSAKLPGEAILASLNLES
jgi:hypothetical protein